MTEQHDDARGSADGRPAAEGSPKRSVAARLVDLAQARYAVFLGEDGEPYAVQRDGPGVAWPLRGREGLRQRLARGFFVASGQVASAAALADALNVLEGQALEADRRPVALRTAAHGRAVVLDLGTADGRQVVIRPGAWSVVERGPVVFRRTALTSLLPAPVRGGSLAPLRELLNVSDDGFRLAVGWLLFALVPDRPHPILALFGEQGTGKSNVARMLTQLVDPSPAPLRTGPREVGDWAVTAAASWVVALDNLSTIAPWFSDALCRAVTGDGLPRRALYTNADVAVVSFLRPIILTSIDAGALAGDLAERLVPLELEGIPGGARRTEEAMRTAFDRAAPAVLGALLDLLARVLTALPDVEVGQLPRMADFARFLSALDQVTGWTTRATYEATFADVASQVIESDPFAAALVRVMETRAEWTGTAGALLDHITPDKPPRGWPRTPRAASGAVKRATPALATAGIAVTHTRDTSKARARLITLTATGGATTRGQARGPSAPSEPAAHPADQPQPADDTAGAPPTGTDDQGATVHPMRPPSSRSSALSTPYELHERITSEVADGTDGRSDHPHRCAVCDQPMTPLLEPGQTTHPACDQPQTPCEACGNPNESTEVSPYCHGCRTPEEVSAYAG